MQRKVSENGVVRHARQCFLFTHAVTRVYILLHSPTHVQRKVSKNGVVRPAHLCFPLTLPTHVQRKVSDMSLVRHARQRFLFTRAVTRVYNLLHSPTHMQRNVSDICVVRHAHLCLPFMCRGRCPTSVWSDPLICVFP